MPKIQVLAVASFVIAIIALLNQFVGFSHSQRPFNGYYLLLLVVEYGLWIGISYLIYYLSQFSRKQLLPTWKIIAVHLIVSICIAYIHIMLMALVLPLSYPGKLNQGFFRAVDILIERIYFMELISYWGILAFVVIYRRFQSKTSLIENENQKLTSNDRCLVENGNRSVYISIGEIAWIESAGNYLKLHVNNQHYLLREKMHVFQAKVSEQDFIRIHRSAIVNLTHIKEIVKDQNGSLIIVLKNDDQLPVSRRRRKNVQKIKQLSF